MYYSHDVMNSVLPCDQVTILLRDHVTMLPSDHVTMPPCDHVAMLPCNDEIMGTLNHAPCVHIIMLYAFMNPCNAFIKLCSIHS
jgi:hypothetical protein